MNSLLHTFELSSRAAERVGPKTLMSEPAKEVGNTSRQRCLGPHHNQFRIVGLGEGASRPQNPADSPQGGCWGCRRCRAARALWPRRGSAFRPGRARARRNRGGEGFGRMSQVQLGCRDAIFCVSSLNIIVAWRGTARSTTRRKILRLYRAFNSSSVGESTTSLAPASCSRPACARLASRRARTSWLSAVGRASPTMRS